MNIIFIFYSPSQYTVNHGHKSADTKLILRGRHNKNGKKAHKRQFDIGKVGCQ